MRRNPSRLRQMKAEHPALLPEAEAVAAALLLLAPIQQQRPGILHWLGTGWQQHLLFPSSTSALDA